MSKRRQTTSPSAPPTLDLSQLSRREIWGAALITLSLTGGLALASIFRGAGGLAIARFLRSLLGWGAYPIIVVSLAAGIWLLVGPHLNGLRIRPSQALGLELFLLACLGLLHLPLPVEQSFILAASGSGGGYVGWALGYLLSGLMGRLGAGLVLALAGFLGAALAFDISWPFLTATIEQALASLAGRMAGAAPPPEQPLPAQPSAPPPVTPPPAEPRPTPHRLPVLPKPPAHRSGHVRARNPRLPPLDLLVPASALPEDEAEVRYQAQIIEETLAHFGVPAQVVDTRRGPTVTQFGVEPGFIERKRADGTTDRRKVRVSRIAGLANDLALALAAPSIRIEAPVPGRPLVGIEVPNRSSSLVNLRSVVESDAFRRINSRLRVALGLDVSGQPVAADLASMPHLLIAGATGSGKSVCINTLIACLLLENEPDDLQLILIDPKRVELGGFNGVPHLAAPVVVEVEQTVYALRWVCRQMDERYKAFARLKVRNIEGYNAAAGRRKGAHLPYLVVFVDELADLMMVAPDEVERSLCRVAQMGRATGIHLVVATQRPSVDVVTGLIKANFPARIAFAVSTQIDSRVILDAPGAEQLLGRGDMLFMSPEGNRLQRLQGCFVSDEELAAITNHWRETLETGLDTQSPSLPWADLAPEEGEGDDPLLSQAIELVSQAGQASASFLQRRLRIGYGRAARLVEELEARGVVGPDPGGGRPRQVLSPTPADGPKPQSEAGDEDQA